MARQPSPIGPAGANGSTSARRAEILGVLRRICGELRQIQRSARLKADYDAIEGLLQKEQARLTLDFLGDGVDGDGRK
jgi:hypothetical protein